MGQRSSILIGIKKSKQGKVINQETDWLEGVIGDSKALALEFMRHRLLP
jgi:hypothetical protein